LYILTDLQPSVVCMSVLKCWLLRKTRCLATVAMSWTVYVGIITKDDKYRLMYYCAKFYAFITIWAFLAIFCTSRPDYYSDTNGFVADLSWTLSQPCRLVDMIILCLRLSKETFSANGIWAIANTGPLLLSYNLSYQKSTTKTKQVE